MPIDDDVLASFLDGSAGIAALDLARDYKELQQRIITLTTERDGYIAAMRRNSDVAESAIAEREAAKEAARAREHQLRKALADTIAMLEAEHDSRGNKPA